MPFAFDLRHWVSAADFAAHLQAHAPSVASWAQGAIIHHTYKPVQTQWSGASTVQGIKNYYETTNGWTAGPHLFIVAGSPNPANDGIWQMTPLSEKGVHAGACNSTHWGIEVVGNYDQAPWDDATRALVVGAVAELFRWRSLTVSNTSLKGHRDCNSPKTCPGTKINLADVRAWVSDYLTPPVPVTPPTPPPVPVTPPTPPPVPVTPPTPPPVPVTPPTPPPVPITQDATWLAAPRCTMPQAIAYIQSQKRTTAYTSADISMHLVPTYWDFATTVGVDPCVLFAHMMLASDRLQSPWALPGRWNMAEVGVIASESRSTQPVPDDLHNWTFFSNTNRWKKGLTFDSLGTGVLAHVGRIVAYAVAPAQRNPAQVDMVTQALLMRSLPPTFHGCAPTLAGLDHRWKYPGPRYGERVALIAEAMRLQVVP